MTILYLDSTVKKNKPNTLVGKDKCPFCGITERVIERQGTMAWIENKYQTVQGTYQTLIIETDKCNHFLNEYDISHLVDFFRFTFGIRDKMMGTGKYTDVLFMKNQGHYAGGSIAHSHSQLIGFERSTFKNQLYNKYTIKDTLSGVGIYKDDNLTVNISDNPMSEFYEFNIIWSNKCDYEFVKWVKIITEYIKIFKDKTLAQYNISFYEIDNTYVLKIIPRGPNSIYLLGYGLRQLPSDITDIAEELSDFHKITKYD